MRTSPRHVRRSVNPKLNRQSRDCFPAQRCSRVESLEPRHLLSAGQLDSTFGSAQTGLVTAAFPGFTSSQANAMAMQSDGKIVLAGSVADGTKYDLAVARFLPDGQPDASFGHGGLATADVSGRSYSGHIIHVGPNEDYTTIQAGYDAAQDGDTLLIDDGLYTLTSTFLVQKQLTFAAVNVGGAVVSGGGTGPDDAVFRLATDATFIGLHLENATNGLYQRDAGAHGVAENVIVTDVSSAININNSGSTSGSFDVRNSTIANADTAVSINDGGTIQVQNTIIANVQTAYGAHDNIAINPDHDLLFNVATVSATTSSGHVSADPAQIIGDPLFANAAQGDFHLLPGSPAIQSGTPDGVPFFGSAPERGAFDTQQAVPAPAIALQRDGKVVIVGSAASNTGNVFAIARFNADGSPDDGSSSDSTPGDHFGVAGLAATDFPGTTLDYAYGVAVQSTGKIVVGGYSGSGFPTANFALARYNTDGTLDDGGPGDSTPGDHFGTNGLVSTDFYGGTHDFITSIAVQSDDKIVAGGLTSTGNPEFGLARYTADGALDPTFGNGGLVSTLFPVSNSQRINALALQSDGKILAVGGMDFSYFGAQDFAIARYDASGQLDTSFNGTGWTTTDFGGDQESAAAVAVQPDGKAVVAGFSNAGGTNQFALARFNSDGNLDTNFGTGGKLLTDFGTGGATAFAVGVQSDGKIVAAGTTQTGAGSEVALARYKQSEVYDIHMLRATTTDSRSVTVNYEVLGDSIDQPVQFNVYRSDASSLNAQSIQIGQVIDSDLGDLSTGKPHDVQLSLSAALVPDALRPYVVVVATMPNGQLVQTDNSVAFETYLLGVVTNGFELLSGAQNKPVAWLGDMASALRAQDYSDVISFDWAPKSIVPVPGIAVAEGDLLAAQVAAKAHQLTLQPNSLPGSVVDVHFIGHSRGAVVISRALQDLSTATAPEIQGGYMRMTMLDPHPAQFRLLPLASLGEPQKLAILAAIADDLVETLMNDPDVVVPDNVDEAEVYYQHTPALLTLDPIETILNLWGTTAVVNQSQSPIQFHDVTGIGIGHSEVHDWYQEHIIPELDDPASLGPALAGGSQSVAVAPHVAQQADGLASDAASINGDGAGGFYPTLVDNRGIATSLESELNASLDAYERGDLAAAVNILRAFESHVVAQSGNHITADNAELLVTVADFIIDGLSAAAGASASTAIVRSDSSTGVGFLPLPPSSAADAPVDVLDVVSERAVDIPAPAAAEAVFAAWTVNGSDQWLANGRWR